MNVIKIDTVEIDSKRVDQSSMKYKISTEATRFGAKASMLSLKYYGEIALDFDLLHILELYENGTRTWMGYIDLESYQYDVGEDVTTFTCYDLIKLLPTIWNSYFEEQKLLGLTVDEVCGYVVEMVLNYLSQKSGHLYWIDKTILLVESEQVTDFEINGLDANFDQYAVVNRRASSTISGIRVALDNSVKMGVFAEAITTGTSNKTYYLGVLDGTFGYYFSDTDNVRKAFLTTANYASDLYYVIKKDYKIAIYWWYLPNASTLKFQVAEIDWNGVVSTLIDVLVDNSWGGGSYPEKCLRYDGLNLVVEDKPATALTRITPTSTPYSVGNNINDPMKYSGGLSKFFRYPYWYETDEEANEAPNCLKVLNDLAVFFDGFYTFYDGILRFRTEAACTNRTLFYHKEKAKGISELKYDLTNSLHPNNEYYRGVLTEYYQNRYGNRYRKYEIETLDAVSLWDKIDGKRVVEIANSETIKKVTLLKGGV